MLRSLERFPIFLPLGADASVVRGRLKSVNLVAAWQLSPEEYNTLLPLRIVLANESVTMKRMRFFDEPIFVHIMLAVGNFGHTFLQNALPAVLSMSHSSLKHRHPFQTIALNDCKACGFPNPSDHTCMDGIGSFGYTSCDSVRASVYKAITGHGLKFSRELFESGESHLCFRNVVVGFPGGNRFDMLYNPSAEHSAMKTTCKDTVRRTKLNIRSSCNQGRVETWSYHQCWSILQRCIEEW